MIRSVIALLREIVTALVIPRKPLISCKPRLRVPMGRREISMFDYFMFRGGDQWRLGEFEHMLASLTAPHPNPEFANRCFIKRCAR